MYRRVLIKVSGEVLSGDRGFGLDFEALKGIGGEIKECADLGCRIGIVIGGGNFLRGVESEKEGVDRIRADYMGIMATYINGLALEETFERLGVKSKIFGAINVEKLACPLSREEVLKLIEDGYIMIFCGGTGNPFFSTDTAAVLRASEMNAEIIIKGTKVEGIYDKDPKMSADANFIPEITYKEVLEKGLKVMDLPAVALAMERGIPICVINIRERGNLLRAIMKSRVGSIIKA